MAYSVDYLEDVGAVQTVYAGTLAQGELDEALTATGTVAAENLCNRFLIDCREMAPGSDSVVDVWALAGFLASLPPGTIEREAILLPAADKTAAESLLALRAQAMTPARISSRTGSTSTGGGSPAAIVGTTSRIRA